MTGSSEPAETDVPAVGADDDEAPNAQALGAKYPALLSMGMQDGYDLNGKGVGRWWL